MENSFGEFLKQKRQEKNLTQKELAKILIVSESAVSKWEKDVAHPDITLLPKISQTLGVTEHELITASIDNKAREEKALAKKWRTFSMSWGLFFYVAYSVTLISCFICNLAINKTLSWFWIVLSALVFAFAFTNLPKLIKKHKLILLPLSMFFSLCLLLAVCCIYSNGNWFWVVSLSVLFGLVIIFAPIYISRYNIFFKIKKYNCFVSLALDFVLLNILLFVINLYTNFKGVTSIYWCFNIALPIVAAIYLILNLLISIKFLKINKMLKTSIILTLISLFIYIPPLFIKVDNTSAQYEIYSLNIFKANFLNWQTEISIERNVHCIIFLTILILAVIFFIAGIIKAVKSKK